MGKDASEKTLFLSGSCNCTGGLKTVSAGHCTISFTVLAKLFKSDFDPKMKRNTPLKSAVYVLLCLTGHMCGLLLCFGIRVSHFAAVHVKKLA